MSTVNKSKRQRQGRYIKYLANTLMTKEATMALVPPEQEEAFVEALKKRLATIKANPLLAAMLQSATGITDHTSLAAVLAKKDIRDAEKKE